MPKPHACKPEGKVRDVVFPAAGGVASVLAAIVREHKASGSFDRQCAHGSALLPICATTDECSPPCWVSWSFVPTIRCIVRCWMRSIGCAALVMTVAGSFVPKTACRLDGVVPPKWRDLILEKDSAGGVRVNRANYEICVLTGVARTLALQGDLGGGRRSLPQSR